jgi:lipoprotein
MKQLKYLLLLSFSIISFSCTRALDVDAIARISILNEKKIPFKAEDASRFEVYPVGRCTGDKINISKDSKDLTYELELSSVEGIKLCTNITALEKKLLDHMLKNGAIKIIDKNGEYKDKIQNFTYATYREYPTKTYTYEIYDTIILEKK